ncbi:MAG: S41 family peptidase [Paludibacter sp.]|jgi:hypothetical protein|nr:S41 family peptidase [Paludibacter sp.]
MKKIIVIILSAVIVTSCFEQAEVYKNTNQGNFDALWKIIDTRYCYLEYKNINWDSIYNVYSEQVNENMDKYALFDLFSKMLSELRDGHVNLYSSFDISRYPNFYSDYPANFSSSLIVSERYLGRNYRIAGGMYYRKINNGSIAYIYFGDFSSSFGDGTLSNIFSQFAACDALIIDVRNNGGGLLSNAELLASYFFENETITGYMQHKTGDGHNDFSKPVEIRTPAHKTVKWTKPVAILTNRHSYSATNDFVNRMRYAPKSVIVGDFTGGGGGLPFSSEIPNGWMLRFSASPMFDAEMQHTEWGIAPDVPILLLPNDEERGIDTVIEKAIEVLQESYFF